MSPGQQQQQHMDTQMASFVKDLDAFNSPSNFLRATCSTLPNSVSGKQKTNVPLGMVLQPLAPGAEVPTVNMGPVGSIVRCKNCRTYVNPFIQWEANGRRWTCNLCGHVQQTPDNFYSNLDESGKRTDRFDRAELSRGAVEYIAPAEYMVRPPQPPVFMFVIDVSYTSVRFGVLDAVIAGIKEAIASAKMPGDGRLQVGIMTFDTSLHFYNLNPNQSTPQMFVVADLEDIFLPLPDDILVNANDSESSILNLLDQLPTMFKETTVNESCMGSAIKGAYMAMKHIGGKMLVFSACIPSIGDFALKSSRENNRLLGTDREVELLRPVSEGLKEFAVELTRSQISVELFVAPQAYTDLASIAPIANFTGGDVRYYGGFQLQQHGLKLKSELVHVLTRYMGWEAVMRVRVSRGWKITNFFGHYYLRGTDLLVVPNCHADQTFAISVDLEDNANPDPIMCVQSALLYTNCDGERRIRVHTWAAVTSPNFTDVVNSVDVQATITLLSHIALSQSLQTTLSDGRNKLQQHCQQIVQTNNVSNAETLQFLPLYIMGMLKSPAFRSTNDLTADLRTFIWCRLATLSVSQLASYFYPRMFGLHDMDETCGVADAEGRVVLPTMMSLTSESLTQDGIYLLEDGESILIWIGRAADANFLQNVFGMPSFDQFDSNMAGDILGTRGDPLSNRVGSIIQQVREERFVPYLQLHVIRHGEPKETKFFASLIEDRTMGMQSTYAEFLQRMGYRPQQQQQQPQQMGAPPMRR